MSHPWLNIPANQAITTMTRSHKPRKPIDQLRLPDIEVWPIWEFATDEESDTGQDETWVRPLKSRIIPRDAFSLTVAATFTSSGNRLYRGVVGVSTFGEFEAVHAAVLTADEYVFIPWPGLDGASKFTRQAARELGVKESDLFPLRYRLDALIQGEPSHREGIYSYANSDA